MCYYEQCRSAFIQPPQRHILSASICHKHCLSFDSPVDEKVVDRVLLIGLCCRSRDSFYVSSYDLDLFVFFILKTATAIELSGVISIAQIAEKRLLSFQEDS